MPERGMPFEPPKEFLPPEHGEGGDVVVVAEEEQRPKRALPFGSRRVSIPEGLSVQEIMQRYGIENYATARLAGKRGYVIERSVEGKVSPEQSEKFGDIVNFFTTVVRAKNRLVADAMVRAIAEKASEGKEELLRALTAIENETAPREEFRESVFQYLS